MSKPPTRDEQIDHTLRMLAQHFAPGELGRMTSALYEYCRQLTPDVFKRLFALGLCIKKIELGAARRGLGFEDGRAIMFDTIDRLVRIDGVDEDLLPDPFDPGADVS